MIGRRNLTDGWKWELAQVKRKLLQEKGRGKQGERTDLLSIVDKKLDDKHNTQKELASELGWSTETELLLRSKMVKHFKKKHSD